MNNIPKLQSTSSTFTDNSLVSTLNALSLQRILYQQSPSMDQSYVIVKSIVNDHANDLLTRSILIDNAVKQRGFLPYNYRLANTFESIRQQRSYFKSSTKLPTINLRKSNRTSTRTDAFGNVTNKMNKLAEQRLILREISIRKKHNLSPIIDKQEKSSISMNDADFATDIPTALNLILQKTKRKSTVELHLFETLKRERLHQARYRLLPINRAPYA